MAERIDTFVTYGSCTVYTLFDEDDRALYVGLTARGMARLFEHKNRGTSWWRDVAYARFEHVPSRAVGHRRERELIRELAPLHNTLGKAVA